MPDSVVASVGDISTVDELAGIRPNSRSKQLGTTLWNEQKRVGGKRALAQWMGLANATVAARLLARPIPQECDAFHSG